MTTDLAKIGGLGGLRVISRTSTAQYKTERRKTVQEIARELNVDAVVEGAVLRSGNRVRITAQLIQAVPEKHLWADSYERDLQGVLALQSDVARAIANEVRIRLAPRDTRLVHRIDPEAYELYLRGLHEGREWTEDGTKKSIAHLEQAIQKDPRNGDAWARLSWAYANSAYFGWETAQGSSSSNRATASSHFGTTLAFMTSSAAWACRRNIYRPARKLR